MPALVECKHTKIIDKQRRDRVKNSGIGTKARARESGAYRAATIRDSGISGGEV